MISPDYIPQSGDLLTTETHWVRIHEVRDEVYYASGRHGKEGNLYRKPYQEFIEQARAKAERLERDIEARASLGKVEKSSPDLTAGEFNRSE